MIHETSRLGSGVPFTGRDPAPASVLSSMDIQADLVLRHSLTLEIIRDCQAAVPREACGLIVARDGDASTRWIPITNADTTPEHRYTFDSMEYLAAIDETDQRGERVLAIVHSHPSGPPRPSGPDIAYALDESVHWIIVDLSGYPTLRCFDIADGQATPEVLVVVEG